MKLYELIGKLEDLVDSGTSTDTEVFIRDSYLGSIVRPDTVEIDDDGDVVIS